MTCLNCCGTRRVACTRIVWMQHAFYLCRQVSTVTGTYHWKDHLRCHRWSFIMILLRFVFQVKPRHTHTHTNIHTNSQTYSEQCASLTVSERLKRRLLMMVTVILHWTQQNPADTHTVVSSNSRVWLTFQTEVHASYESSSWKAVNSLHTHISQLEARAKGTSLNKLLKTVEETIFACSYTQKILMGKKKLCTPKYDKYYHEMFMSVYICISSLISTKFVEWSLYATQTPLEKKALPINQTYLFDFE